MRGRALVSLLTLLAIAASAAASAQTSGEPLAARARVVARVEATLSSEMAGRILRLELEAGDRFERGERLVVLDCDEPRARLQSASAVLGGAERVYQAKKRLESLNGISEVEVAVAEADVAKARADVALLKVLASRCEITAPFAGRVVKRHAQRNETVAPGQKLLDILNDATLEVELLVPSRWLAWLAPGAPLSVSIDETGTTHRASVRAIGAKVDAVSQSIVVIAAFSAPPAGLLAGMSGEARFAASH